MEMKIYISGKITGLEPKVCRAKFAAMEAKLKAIGVHTVINPMNLGITDSWSHDDAMDLCMTVLKKNATSIILLNDWIESIGAIEEYYYARNHGFRIFAENETDKIKGLVDHDGLWVDTSNIEFP